MPTGQNISFTFEQLRKGLKFNTPSFNVIVLLSTKIQHKQNDFSLSVQFTLFFLLSGEIVSSEHLQSRK